MRGVIFEVYAHNVLQKKGTWKVRSLSSNETLEFSFDNRELEQFDSLDKLVLKENVYYRPNVKHFGALDSLERKGDMIYLFQMTVAAKHPVKADVLEDHITKLTETNKSLSTASDKPLQFKLIFVTPPDVFPSYKKAQSYKYKSKSKKSKKKQDQHEIIANETKEPEDKEPENKEPENKISEVLSSVEQLVLELTLGPST